MGSRLAQRRELRHCAWCGRALRDAQQIGRRRRYCAQACRQRAYEQRSSVQRAGLPDDAVVLSDAELVDLADRLFQLRCAAEDVVTAVESGAPAGELRALAADLTAAARAAEHIR